WRADGAARPSRSLATLGMTGVGQLQVPIDDVCGRIDLHVAVHQPRGRFLPYELPGEAEALSGAAGAGDQRRFHQALEVDGDVVAAYGPARVVDVGKRPLLERDRNRLH